MLSMRKNPLVENDFLCGGTPCRLMRQSPSPNVSQVGLKRSLKRYPGDQEEACRAWARELKNFRFRVTCQPEMAKNTKEAQSVDGPFEGHGLAEVNW